MKPLNGRRIMQIVSLALIALLGAAVGVLLRGARVASDPSPTPRATRSPAPSPRRSASPSTAPSRAWSSARRTRPTRCCCSSTAARACPSTSSTDPPDRARAGVHRRVVGPARRRAVVRRGLLGGVDDRRTSSSTTRSPSPTTCASGSARTRSTCSATRGARTSASGRPRAPRALPRLHRHGPDRAPDRVREARIRLHARAVPGAGRHEDGPQARGLAGHNRTRRCPRAWNAMRDGVMHRLGVGTTRDMDSVDDRRVRARRGSPASTPSPRRPTCGAARSRRSASSGTSS